MKSLLFLLFLPFATFAQADLTGNWVYKLSPQEFQLKSEDVSQTNEMLSDFYLDLRKDFTFEMNIKGTIHTGKYKFNKEQTILILNSDVAKVLKFEILEIADETLTIRMFNTYTAQLEKRSS